MGKVCGKSTFNLFASSSAPTMMCLNCFCSMSFSVKLLYPLGSPKSRIRDTMSKTMRGDAILAMPVAAFNATLAAILRTMGPISLEAILVAPLLTTKFCRANDFVTLDMLFARRLEAFFPMLFFAAFSMAASVASSVISDAAAHASTAGAPLRAAKVPSSTSTTSETMDPMSAPVWSCMKDGT